jgi:hypothetical protein
MIVKILTATGATRFINVDNVQDVVVSDSQVTVFFAQDDETANIFSLEEATPMLDALEMLADETARKVDFHKSTRNVRASLPEISQKEM